MQLFVTHYQKQGTLITINEERVVHQLKNVLRAKVDGLFKVQNREGNIVTRITCKIISIDKEKIVTSIEGQEEFQIEDNQKYLFVALPNKFEKLELIVQKCTEIGLQHIIFFPSQYSQLHDIVDKKIERLEKIALEAIEQSYGFIMPEIIFSKDIGNYITNGKNFLLHQDGKDISNSIINIKNRINFFVGPEGGRGSEDEIFFEKHSAEKISLGRNILRTETAAIVVAREAINNAS